MVLFDKNLKVCFSQDLKPLIFTVICRIQVQITPLTAQTRVVFVLRPIWIWIGISNDLPDPPPEME